MVAVAKAAEAFLSHRRIAVTGVTREPKGHGANVVYQRLRERGYDVFAVNPHADRVEGDTCYHSLREIPGGAEAVVLATRPEHDMGTLRECVELGISQAWMHRSFGGGSVDDAATEYGRAHGVTVIDGGCPLMFEPASDGGHRMMKWAFTLNGHVPRQV